MASTPQPLVSPVVRIVQEKRMCPDFEPSRNGGVGRGMKPCTPILRWTAALLAAAMMCSCHSTRYPRRTAATGALIGAGTGALIGSGSGNAGRGALIGATVGAIAGGAYGNHRVRKHSRHGYNYYRSAYDLPAYSYRPNPYRRAAFYRPVPVNPYYY